MQCAELVTYSFYVKYNIGGPTNPGRGLRQGEPFSPHLFVLNTQGLASLVARYQHINIIQGVQIARGAPVFLQVFFCG